MIANRSITAGEAIDLFGRKAPARSFKSKRPEFPTWRPLAPGAVLLAIDPSIASCGWGLLHNVVPRAVRLDSGCWHPTETEERSRFDHLSLLVAQRIRLAKESGTPITDAIIETPGGGQRGDRSATQLMVYARAIGICEATCYRAKIVVHRVTVNEWKGSTKKSHGTAIVQHFLGYQPREHNESDALALGAWLTSQRVRRG